MLSGMLNDARLLFIVISFILIHQPLIISKHVNNFVMEYLNLDQVGFMQLLLKF